MPPALIKARKRLLAAGEWRHGKVAAQAFPVHGSGVPLSGKWAWRVMRLVANDTGLECRLLIAVRVDTQSFMALLGLPVERKMKVIASLEDHGTHPGLHCHAPCGRDPGEVPVGSVRYGQGIAPLPKKRHRRTVSWTNETAMRVSLSFFKVDDRPDGAML